MAMTFAQTQGQILRNLSCLEIKFPIQVQKPNQYPAEAIALANTPAQAFANTKAISPFGRFTPETARQMDTPKQEIDPRLQMLLDAWGRVSIEDVYDEYADIYEKAVKAVCGIDCTPDELDRFMAALPNLGGYGKDKFELGIGPFISALINNGSAEEYVIRTEHLDHSIDCLGMFNNKHITVRGDVGHGVGRLMQGGNLIVEGNAGAWAGYEMAAGNLTITKNAGWCAGRKMGGGILTVMGDVGTELAKEMHGGEIQVHGRYKGLDECIYDGHIFVRGREVQPFWRRNWTGRNLTINIKYLGDVCLEDPEIEGE